MTIPAGMTPQQWQVFQAMLQQNGAVAQGAPNSPPNFTMPGQGPRFNPQIMSGEGMIPPTQPGTSLVPYQAPGLPATTLQQTAGAPVPPPEVPSPGGAAEALGGAGEGAGIGAAETAATPSLMMRLLGSPVARTLGGLGLAASALSNDPGHLPETNSYGPGAGGTDKLAQSLNPSDSDTPILGLGKSFARGTAKAGMAIDDFLFKPKSANATEATAPSPSKSQNLQGPTIEQALGLEAPSGGSSGTGAGPLSGTRFESQGKGRNPVLDALEGNIGATAPQGYKGGSEEISNEMQAAAGERAIAQNTPGLRPGMYGGLMGDAAQRETKAQYQMGQAALALAAQERQSKWAIDAAKAGTAMEKENQAESDASMKIHANHGHFLIEQTTIGQDGKPQKTLMPLDDAYFGIKRGATGGIDPHASVTVMGQKFSNLDKDPFAKEALLLGNIQKDGQLSDVMNMPEVSKKIHAATIEGTRSLVGLPGNATPEQIGAEVARQGIPKASIAKAQVDAQRGMIFMMMQKDPQFKQKLINMQYDLHNNKGVPGGGALALDNPKEQAPNAAPVEEASEPGEDSDFLSQLDNAQGK